MVSNAVKKMRAAGRAYIAKKRVTGGTTSTTSNSALARQKQQSEAIERWKRGEISKEEASKLVKKIQRGGGSGAAADPRKWQLAQEAIKKFKAQKAQTEKLAEEKRIAEAKTFAENKHKTPKKL